MRNYLRLAIDLTLVGLSPFLAIFIRNNFDPSFEVLQGLSLYALLCFVAAALVIPPAKLHQRVWRYTSLLDAFHLMAAVSVILALALPASFVLNRLEGVARSLPVIQGLLLISAMIGIRLALRMWLERADHSAWRSGKLERPVEHVLIVGVSDLTELYLRSVAEFAPADITVVGILSQERGLHGRLMRLHRILGAPKDIQQIITQLEVHGVTVDRIAVMQSFEQLSHDAQKALLTVERSSDIKVDWLVESLGLRQGPASAARNGREAQPSLELRENEAVSPGWYHRVKRALDVVAAASLLVALAPVMAMVALLVALDVGFPLVFWQQRPGRYGRPFKLLKFRTMGAAHDREGNRLLDQLRCSRIGNFLRRSWLDELPQLYNILVGQMSFVGPRPLLPLDQPKDQELRLLVRPGLTGWAQINGGRDISPEDKARLDIWYIVHASLWLDIAILLRTLVVVVLGERVSGGAVKAVHARLSKNENKIGYRERAYVLTDPQS
jgi:lipopolysaccharide/colanic/teichoic acid biosynthesis glycosyltransferase